MGTKATISCFFFFFKSDYKNYLTYSFSWIFLSASSGLFCGTKKNSHAWLGVCALEIYLHMFIMYAREIAVYACIWKYKYLYIFNKNRIYPRHFFLGWFRLEILLLLQLSFKLHHGFLFFPSYPKLMTEYLHLIIFSQVYFCYFLPVVFSGYQQKAKITTDSLPDNTPSPTLASYKQCEWCGKHVFYCVREPLRAVSFPIKN